MKLLILVTVFIFNNLINNSLLKLRKETKDEDDEPLKKTGDLNIAKSQKKYMNNLGINFQSFIQIYKNHQLTLGEIKHIFLTGDLDRDNYVNSLEWSSFYKLFVLPFERCDEDLDYLLNEKELTKCFESKYLNQTRFSKDNVQFVINALDRQLNITFIDYVFLRRVNLAWKECTTDFQLAQSKLDCALQVTVPGRRVDLPEAGQVLRVIEFIKNGKYREIGVIINLLDFLYISHQYYYFSAFELPFLDGYLNKKDILRSIENQQLASTLTPYIINNVFESDSQDMDFMHFTCVMYIYQLFNKYSEGEQFLVNTQWILLMTNKLPELPLDLLNLIDGNFQVAEDIFKLSDKIIDVGTEKYTEKDFLINFIQVGIKSKKSQKIKITNLKLNRKLKQKQNKQLLFLKQNQYRFLQSKKDDNKVKKGPGIDPKLNEQIFFNIMDIKKNQKVFFTDFFQAIKFMWAFFNFDQDGNGFLVDRELREGLLQDNLPLPFTQKEHIYLNDCLQFLSNGNSLRLNLKEFLAFSFYQKMFDSLRVPGSLTNVMQNDLQLGFDQLGLQLTEKTIKQSQEGNDESIGLPIYNFVSAFKMTLEKEIVAIRLQGIDVKDEDTLKDAQKGKSQKKKKK